MREHICVVKRVEVFHSEKRAPSPSSPLARMVDLVVGGKAAAFKHRNDGAYWAVVNRARMCVCVPKEEDAVWDATLCSRSVSLVVKMWQIGGKHVVSIHQPEAACWVLDVRFGEAGWEGKGGRMSRMCCVSFAQPRSSVVR